jgi:carbon starvation protein
VDALALVVVPFVGYLIAYRLYGRFLAERIFALRPDAAVPSRELEDGQDYVPTRKGVIFGHHFTSIAGTGPIVGPAIGIIWGWVPALIWVFVGSIVMGAVHDFGSLVVSLRNEGKSLSEVAARYVNKRVRTISFLIVFFELWIVIAIFGLVIAFLFASYKEAVFPVWMEIPIAVALGWGIYKKKAKVVVASIVAVAAMYATVVVGHFLPLSLPVAQGQAAGVWTIILLLYAYIASTLPVTTLLQPRDYINAWQLFIAMGLLVIGVVGSSLFGGMHIVAPPLQLAPAGAPPLWPFLFVTIACGAISGFHSVVASGTSPKQIANEKDALFVGYGSMLTEGALAVLVIAAVAAGVGMGFRMDKAQALKRVPAAQASSVEALPVDEEGRVTLTESLAWTAHYSSWGGASGLKAKVDAVVEGSANMMSAVLPAAPFWKGLCVVIMGVFIASFAGTTLDTATRLQRYVVSELASDWKIPAVGNKYVATAVAVVTAAALAFSTGMSGKGALTLWPMFGAVNQLLAALALLLVTVYLRRKGGLKFLVTAIPCVFMLVMTMWAMVLNEHGYIFRHEQMKLGGAQRWFLVCFNSAVLILAVWMTVESALVFFSGKASGGEDETPVVPDATGDAG